MNMLKYALIGCVLLSSSGAFAACNSAQVTKANDKEKRAQIGVPYMPWNDTQPADGSRAREKEQRVAEAVDTTDDNCK